MQIQELSDFFQRKAEFLITLDEGHAFQIGGFVASLSRSIAQGSGQQSLALVKPDRLDVYRGLPGQFADTHAVIVKPIPGYKARGERNGRRGQSLWRIVYHGHSSSHRDVICHRWRWWRYTFRRSGMEEGKRRSHGRPGDQP